MHALAGVLRRIMDGKVPPAARGLLACATLIAIEKPNSTTPRPIGLTTAFRRTAASWYSRVRKADVITALGPTQLGASPNGREVGITGIRAYLHANPTHVCLKLDIKNAFNCMHRNKMTNSVAKGAPS